LRNPESTIKNEEGTVSHGGSRIKRKVIHRKIKGRKGGRRSHKDGKIKTVRNTKQTQWESRDVE
jgi:hypothetical protein